MNHDRPSRGVSQMVYVSLFAAIIVVMSSVPFLGYIPLGIIRATTIHIPVIIGSLLLGPRAGAVLGFVFGLTSFLSNTFTPNATSFVFTPFYSLGDAHGSAASLLVCFVPRILVGVVPWLVFRGLQALLKKRGEVASLALAGFAGSMTNTLLVMHMIYLFFADSYAQARGVAENALYGVILTVIGTNGVAEALVAAFLTAAVTHLLRKALKTERT